MWTSDDDGATVRAVKLGDNTTLGGGRGNYRAGSLVLLGRIETRYATTAPPDVSCGVVWTGSLGSLRRQDLECSDQPLISVVTLADGRVMIAGNTDLWIRG